MMLSSLRFRIFASQIALALLAILTMGSVSYFLITNYISTSQEIKFRYIAYSKIQRIEYYFSENKALMQRIVNSREFEDFHSTFREQALKKHFAKFSQEFSVISYVNKKGREEVKLIKGSISGEGSLRDVSGNPTFQKSLLEPSKVIISPAEPESELGEPVIRLTLSVYGYFGDEFIGTLRAGIPVSKISDIIKDNITKSMAVVLIDSNGNILSDFQKGRIFAKITGKGKEAEKLISDCKALKAGFSRAEILGIDGFVAYAPFKEMGWSLLIILPYKEFMAVPNNLKKITPLIFMIIFVASIIVSFILTKGITRPILKLVNATNSITKGNFSEKVEIYSNNEIGILASAFNKMVENLRATTTSVDNLNREIAERKKAENKIEEQKIFLERVLGSLTYPFYVVDVKDYVIKIANFSAGFGDLSKGLTCYALTHRRDSPCTEGHICPLKEIMRTKKPAKAEHVHYDKDGNARYVEVHGDPIFDNEGNIVQMIEYAIDITGRKKAEERQNLLSKDLEGINKLMVGRELRMIELKKEINKLNQELGRPAPFDKASLE